MEEKARACRAAARRVARRKIKQKLNEKNEKNKGREKRARVVKELDQSLGGKAGCQSARIHLRASGREFMLHFMYKLAPAVLTVRTNGYISSWIMS